MENEKNIETVEEMNNEAYIAAIEELKASTISKDKYNQLRAENKKLLDALVSGEQLNLPKEEKRETARDLRNKLFNNYGDFSNIEFIDTVVKLRDAVIEEGGVDPFYPVGDNVSITSDIIDRANNTAEGLKYILELSEDDPGIFNAQYQRIVKDTMLNKRR